jgi:hypothetical protein
MLINDARRPPMKIPSQGGTPIFIVSHADEYAPTPKKTRLPKEDIPEYPRSKFQHTATIDHKKDSITK